MQCDSALKASYTCFIVAGKLKRLHHCLRTQDDCDIKLMLKDSLNPLYQRPEPVGEEQKSIVKFLFTCSN